ncbi:MAG: hypothetical protein C3F02_02760 [Parcubacteria group bacterium]|nr:MAG: hypothetical protein C3F02_02760 [Parcubacteria group bacterium]
MEKLIELAQSPSSPGIETVDKMVMKLHVPCSEKSVTVQINPFLQDYEENADQPNVQIRQMQITSTTSDTKTLTFDFENNSTHNIDIDGENYQITLMNIGKEKTQDGEFPAFEFLVKKD